MSETKTETWVDYNYQGSASYMGSGGKAEADGWKYPTAEISPPFVPVVCMKSKTGDRLPDYKQRIARGQNATTYFTGTINSLACIPAIEQVYGSTTDLWNPAGIRKSIYRWSHGIYGPPALPDSADATLAANIASTKFYNSLAQTMTAFQGGVFLVELRETLHMIRNPAKALRERMTGYTNHLSRHRGRMMRQPPSNRLKFLSESWLEHSFGWAPLLNDLNSARDLLDRRQNQLVNDFVRITGTGKSWSVAFSNTGYFVGICNLRSENRTLTNSTHVYAGAVASTASGTPLLTMNALGLSPRSFVPTLWEAIPYSFAIDYFTNVGNVLEAWSNQNVGLAWARSTQIRSTTVESFLINTPPVNIYILFERFKFDGKTIARNKIVNRAPLTSVPIPALAFEIPGFGRKWLNIAALATARDSLRFR